MPDLQSTVDAVTKMGLSDLITLAYDQRADDPRVWRDNLAATVPVAMQPYGDALSELGAEWYMQMGGSKRPQVAPFEMDSGQAMAFTSWAFNPPIQEFLTTGDVLPAVSDEAVDRLIGGAERHLRNSARDTVSRGAVEDPTATGYMRVPQPGCCAFCAVMSTKVYKVARNAGVTTGDRRTLRPEGEKYHDFCKCMVRPLYGRGAALQDEMNELNPDRQKYMDAQREAQKLMKSRYTSSLIDRETGEQFKTSEQLTFHLVRGVLDRP